MDAAEKHNKLRSAPVGRLIFFFGLQSGLALAAYSLFALLDTFFVAKRLGDTAAGAVAATVPLLLILSAISTMAGAGGGSVISRALGVGDKAKASKAAANIFLLYWAAALIVTAAGLIFIDPLLRAFGAGGQLFGYAKDYAVIILIGAVTATGFSSLMRAEGSTKFALLIWVIPISLNTAGDVVFMYVFGWGVKGAAAATVMAQCLSVAMSMWFFFVRRRRAYKIALSDFRPDIKLLGEIISLGLPSLLTQLFYAAQLSLYNRFMFEIGGGNAVTAMGFAVKIQSFLILLQSGMVQGAQPVVAYNIKSARAGEALRVSAAMSAAAGIIVAIAGILIRRPSLSLFSNTAEILDTGSTLLLWMLAPSAVSFASGLVTGGFQSAGKQGASAAYITAVNALIRLPAAVIMYLTLGFAGICYSFVISEALVAAASIIFIKIRPITGVKYEKRD